MANANKVKYGLKNVYYAIATFDEDGVPTYATPVRIPGAVNLSLDAEGESENWYADDSIYVVLVANNGYSGDLEIALIPDSFLTDVLHETKDSNGVFVEQSDVEVVHFSLLFEFNGDVHKTRHCLYNCTCSRPGIEAATTEDTNEPQTDTLSITAMPLADGTVKSKTGDDCADNVYNDWFKAVYIPTDADDSGGDSGNNEPAG